MAKKTKTKASESQPASGANRKTPRRNLANPRPRVTEDFDFAANSTQTSRVPKDDRTIKKDAPSLELVRPSWNGKSGTVIRPVPCFDVQIEDDDVFMHSRRSARRNHLSDWIRGYPSVKYIGIDTKLTFVLWDPIEEKANRYEPATNPYMILHRAVQDAVEDSEAMISNKDVLTTKWAPLVGNSQKKAFQYRTYLYFMQGVIYQHNGEILVRKGRPRGLRDKDWTQVIELSKTGAESITDLLDERVEGNFNSDDYNQFRYPDVTSLTDGFFITIYNPDKHGVDVEVVAEDSEAEEDNFGEATGTAEAKKSREYKGWKASISDTFTYVDDGKRKRAKRDLSQLEDEIREKILWWQNLIHVPCHDEISMLCATAYRSMPDLLHYGWQENPEFFTDEVKGILAARTSGPGAEVPPMDDEDDDEVIPDDPSPAKTSQSLPELDDDDDDEYEEIDVDAEAEEKKRAAAASAASRSSKRRKKVKKKAPAGEATEGAPRKKKKKVPPKKEATTSATRKPVPTKKKKKKKAAS